MSEATPRVNSERLPQYIGRTVRLPCRILSKQTDSVTVEASDGGQVHVRVPTGPDAIEDAFAEIICNVSDAGTVKMFSCINMGQDLDMKVVNDTINLTHDPRFVNIWFPPS